MAKYEWIDETGMRRPSLVMLDITGYWPRDWRVPIEEILKHAPIIRQKQIESLQSLELGKDGRVKVRTPRGYERYVWHAFMMNQSYYACFLAYVKRGVIEP